MTTPATPKTEICDAIHARRRFLISSHARPDGDSIGSQLAMAYALEALGKEVRIVNADPAPEHYLEFPGVDRIEIARSVERTDVDAVIVMESGDLTRTGVSGLEGRFTINIDHHQGNTHYGSVNWVDESAAACGEMVFDLVEMLGVPLTIEIATHVYLAILTDTGSFHYANITPKTFEICRRAVAAGVNPGAMARRVFDQNSFGKLKLIGALLAEMDLLDGGRLAAMYLNDEIMNATGTHVQRHRRADQPAAHRAGDSGGGVFQAGGRRRHPPQHALEVRRRRSRDRGAARRRRPQERRGFKVKGPLSAVRDGILEEMAAAIAVGVQTRP